MILTQHGINSLIPIEGGFGFFGMDIPDNSLGENGQVYQRFSVVGNCGLVPARTNNTNVIYSGYDSGLDPYKAFDFSKDNKWVTSTSSDAFVGYDFGEGVIVRACSIIPSYYRANQIKNFKVQGSNDNNVWVDLYSDVIEQSGNDKSFVRFYSFSNETAYRYYRVLIVDTWSSYGCGIVELQFYEKRISIVPKLSDNTGVIYSSEWIDDSNYAYLAFDDFLDTFWSTPLNSSTNEWIGYDFGEPVGVGAVVILPRIFSSHPQLKNFKIQYSDDASTWQDVINGIVNDVTYDQQQLFPTGCSSKHRYWRVYCIDTYNSATICIKNIAFISDEQEHYTIMPMEKYRKSGGAWEMIDPLAEASKSKCVNIWY